MKQNNPKILFSDYFNIDKKILDEYGAFDISLIADLPLFIDPFLLFNSKNPEYQVLHAEIIKYLRFLRKKSVNQQITPGLLSSWYKFKEVKQNWFGYSAQGNSGSALGKQFADALNENFSQIFSDYGDEKITRGSHLEKLCLIKEGVGKDNVSDFTTNLIKDFLLKFTEAFAKQYIDAKYCETFRIRRAKFNYATETWEDDTYYLPKHNGDFVILTPKDLLTKDETWINKEDLINDFNRIPQAITNDELRSQINNYFRRVLPQTPTKKEESEAARKTILEFPQIIDYYIKYKEDHGDQAEDISKQMVDFSENLYVEQFTKLAQLLAKTPFYQTPTNAYSEILKRVHFLKNEIENNDGYRLFYDKHTKQPIEREEDLKICYRLTWFGSDYNFDSEVNNGRGPIDGKASKGSVDAALVEYKLASNKKLKQNLKNQMPIYEKANNTDKCVKVIIYFTKSELFRVQVILKSLKIENEESIILIDARADNKPSASNVQKS